MDALPDDLRRFILARIPSVPFLEAALLLRASPARHFTASELAAALYLPERSAVQLLQALHDGGLTEPAADPPGAWTWAPHDPSLAASMDALARAYADDLVAVTHLIHDATARSAQRFADAFRLRKDR